MAKEPTYFMYFPGNYRWSAAFLNMMSLTPYGASEIGELYKIGRMLKDKAPEDDEAWFNACVKVADGVRAHAERFEKSRPPHLRGARVSPRLQLLPDGRALPHPEGQGGARHLPQQRRVLPSPCGPGRHGIEIVEVPFEGGQPARLLRAGAERRGKRAPCVCSSTAGYHQGAPVHPRRSRSREARHIVPGDGRPRHRRSDPFPRPLSAPRLRSGRLRVRRLAGEAR